MSAVWRVSWGWLVIVAGRDGLFVRLCGAELNWEPSMVYDALPVIGGSVVILAAIGAWITMNKKV